MSANFDIANARRQPASSGHAPQHILFLRTCKFPILTDSELQAQHARLVVEVRPWTLCALSVEQLPALAQHRLHLVRVHACTMTSFAEHGR